MRVDAALDMAENGIDLVPIMHAGGWKSPTPGRALTQQACRKQAWRSSMRSG
jgi:hypothetical protein